MVKADEIISSLLLRHNCVIIPGFGGFVAKQSSAHIDYKSGIISPPRKSLLFNRQLINNDGLLISEFALKNSVSYNDSISTVQQLVNSWNAELSAGNRISIDKVGFLFFDQERNICFEQDREFNLLLSSYGLGSVHFLTEADVAIAQHKIEVMEQAKEEITPFVTVPQSHTQLVEPIAEAIKTGDLKIAKKDNPATVIPVVKSKKSSFWKYAAAACALPILFYSLWIPMKTDVLESKMISFQDFNPFHKQEKSAYQKSSINQLIVPKTEQQKSLEEQLAEVESDDSVYSYNLTDETYVLVKREKVTQNTPEENQVVENVQPIASVKSNNHSLNYIIGCFSDENNANKLVNELKSKGFNASIKDQKGGLHRVTIGGTDSQQEMEQLIAKANALGFNGWILK